MIKVCRAVHLRSIQQTTIERVCPAVISAAEHFARSAPLRRGTRAMTANVIEAAQNAIVPSDDQQRLPGQFRSEVVPWIPNLIAPTNDLPSPAKQRLLLALKQRRIEIHVSRKSPGVSSDRINLDFRFGMQAGNCGHGCLFNHERECNLC